MRLHAPLLALSMLMSLAANAVAAPPAARAAAAALPPEGGEKELSLAVGENQTISAAGVANYSEGVRGVAEVKLTTDRSQFVIVGQKPGTTTLLLIKRDGTQETWVINVLSRPIDAVHREVNQLLAGVTGIRLQRVGGRIFIAGSVNAEADLKLVQQIASLYPGQVESLVSIGTPAADRKLDIRIDFFFVQYERTKDYSFGITWPTTVGGASVVTSTFAYDFVAHVTTGQAAVMNQPLPALDIAADSGWAKVLKQSTVISANGEKATFESGGEQNFPITSGLVSGIKSISFGTNVAVVPQYDARTREIAIQVTADVSDLVAPTGATTLPGRNITHLVTSVDLNLGQSLVLSGIHTRSQRHEISGIPLLSEIPILGVLFGGHTDSKDDVDGAVFIVPSVVETMPPASMDLITKAIRQYEDYSGNFRSVQSYDRRPPVTTATETTSSGVRK